MINFREDMKNEESAIKVFNCYSKTFDAIDYDNFMHKKRELYFFVEVFVIASI